MDCTSLFFFCYYFLVVRKKSAHILEIYRKQTRGCAQGGRDEKETSDMDGSIGVLDACFGCAGTAGGIFS